MNAVQAFFEGRPEATRLFEAVRDVAERLGDVELQVSKSQIAFRRRRTFASVWTPDRYLAGEVAPMVLTVFLRERDPSPRWKQVVEPAPGQFTHQLELRAAGEVDAQVATWLRTAWDDAG